MLIDFTVWNYRSIRDPVTLSAVATRQRARRPETARAEVRSDDEIAQPFEVPGRGFSLLPALAIYGANASGKTNLVRALDALLGIMSYGVGAVTAPMVPFLLSPNTASQPTGFRLRTAVAGAVYDYLLEMHGGQVVREELKWLPAHPARKERTLYRRAWDAEAGSYEWSDWGFRDRSVKLSKDSTPAHQTFASILVLYISVPEVKPLAQWLRTRVPGLGPGLGDAVFNRQLLTYLDTQDRSFLPRMSALVRAFDMSVSDIRLVEDIDRNAPPSQWSVRSDQRLIAVHHGEAGEVSLPLEEESHGTQRLFELAHWLLPALDGGGLVVVDELESGLHPDIAEALVRVFQDRATNPKGAQIVFTTHERPLLEGQLLRRDQVWFTERRPDGVTRLYPLSEFRVRNDLAIDKAYQDGRFGAVPVLPDEDELAELIGARP